MRTISGVARRNETPRSEGLGMPKIVNHDQRRSEIISAMWRVVDSDGVGNVSVRSVAASAGVSKTNIGHYFDSQPHLLALGALESATNVSARIQATLLGEDALGDATALLMRMVPDTAAKRRRAAVWLHVMDVCSDNPSTQDVLLEIESAHNEAITHVLDQLRARKLVHRGRDVAAESATLHALVDGVALQALSSRAVMPKNLARDVLRAHLAGLGAAPRN